MEKHKVNVKRWLPLGIVLLMLLAIGGVSAFMFQKTQTLENNLEPAKLSCTVAEVFDGTYKSEITIVNDASSNIDAYLRVCLISYWVDGSGNVVGKPSEMPEIVIDSVNWVKSASEHIYYYKGTVAPGGETVNLLSQDIELTESTFNDEAVYQVVEVFAEAIQAEPAEAVVEAWKVTLSGDQITSAQ